MPAVARTALLIGRDQTECLIAYLGIPHLWSRWACCRSRGGLAMVASKTTVVYQFGRIHDSCCSTVGGRCCSGSQTP